MSDQELLVAQPSLSTNKARPTVILKPQNFKTLRDNCLTHQTLFTDPEFPATNSSLFGKELRTTSQSRPIEWKRPKQISSDPQLFVEGASRFDIKQGDLGDCWLLAAMANLTLYEKLFAQVVPDDQDFKDNYAGIFHFRFWQYGRWVDVVIDDQLPTSDGSLVYLRSTESNEFWSALLEKAYAKLHGSYEAIDGGLTIEAMQDFTGGVSETYELGSNPRNLFHIMRKAYQKRSMMGCCINPNSNEEQEEVTSEGLAKGHAYSITGVKVFDIDRKMSKVQLIRLRNPWGNDTEWTGAWSDGSKEWNAISIRQRKEIDLICESDGEFWMSFEDFMRHFSRLEICNLTGGSVQQNESVERKQWVLDGEWMRGVTAGGCPNYKDTFWMNTQYRITLSTADDGDDDGECSIVVGLMQKNRRRMGLNNLSIGFVIYRLDNPDRAMPLNASFFKDKKVHHAAEFRNTREVSGRVKLKPGIYCIIPSTYRPHEEAEFILRVLSETDNKMEENDCDLHIGEMDPDILNHPEQELDDRDLEFFDSIAGDDMEVNWKELKMVLDDLTRNETNHQGFSKDVCRSMIAMMDVDRSGQLGFEEFKILLVAISRWKAVFKKYDTDDSGSLDVTELRQAMTSAGYQLNNHMLTTIVHRYSTEDGSITLDDFIMCSVRLKTMIGIFQKKDMFLTGTATFTLGQWMDTILYS